MNDVNPQTPIRATDHVVTTQISVSGNVSDAEQERCVQAVTDAIADISEPIGRCTVRLEHETDPHHARRATARMTVDLDGTPVLAHAVGDTLDAATELASTRLHERLRKHVDRRRDARRHGSPLSHEDWSGNHDEQLRPVVRSIPREERRIERRSSFGPPESTVDEAIFDLDALGYRFHLFVETQSGDDAIVRRHEQRRDAYVIRFVHGERTSQAVEASVAEVEIDVRPAPHLPVLEAVDLLDIADLDDVFFLDRETERGSVVYRRVDGHLGLIAPSG